MATSLADILKAKAHEPPTQYREEKYPAAPAILESLEEEGSSLGEDTSIAELYQTLLVHEDLILVIDKEAEEPLRKGLITTKYKANKAAKERGEQVDGRALEFVILPFTEREESEVEFVEEKIKIQVYLKAKASIRIHKLILTDKEF